ncbi:MAG: hypothetical protein KF799_15105 [Bdellovibrionales bacterium]|nr:hypothetical protein [Bdellovibrionales bacterium]
MPKTNRSISLDEIEKLVHAKSLAKKDWTARFGNPSQTKTLPDKEIWYFDDPSTGLERFSLQFDKSERLTNVLWMPWPQESESQLKSLMARYPRSSFEVLETREKYHSIDTETTYTDHSSMSIWHDDGKQRVIVLGWSMANQSRLPSQSDSTKSK